MARASADYMEQQTSALLTDAVLLDSDFALHRRAVMPPAGLAWLETVPMPGRSPRLSTHPPGTAATSSPGCARKSGSWP
ncbi:hypothetical protein OHU34_44205 (plasmid) [Streptomyces sp. NBC_00080]|uniref:hypothetical protein n=1 Tax=Streptomyces sp. NBC_00080 TaxID=2975645 RepID=UPI00324E95EA